MTSPNDSRVDVLDPLPELWLKPARRQRLQSQFSQISDFLTLAGLLKRSVEYWVCLEISKEACSDETIWPKEDYTLVLSDLESAWLKQNSLEEMGLTIEQLRDKLKVRPASICWAKARWNHRVDAWYLERKVDLDQASCNLLRVSDKNLAFELFHRIKAKEITFAQAAQEFGLGPEASKGGKISQQPMSQLPFGLDILLRSLSPGELTPPQRLGNIFAIVQLDEIVEARLDDAMRQRLLCDEFDRWLRSMTEYALAALKS
ncbi:peptidylprolyl isomerase [Synechococcus sp. GEYO]|uniref:peptidylprolyl isomerase n=1 Tax=Synechococcus sp. GEYO TaxID=2575511 RepID=UPI000E0ECDD3|nr:peptidylprolyl isomerase [Synechococcus sp. GEYO]